MRIALVEDDKSVRDALTMGLINRGHSVQTFATGELALAGIIASHLDVVVLDWMLPGLSGLEVCRGLRASSQIPIVMITARSDDESIVDGLEAGADDYIVKPAEPRVIEARLRAVMRRTLPSPHPESDHRDESTETAVFGDLRVDFDAVTVDIAQTRIELTPTEFRVLATLIAHRGKVLSRHQLLEHVWNYDHLGDSRLVDACIQRLRAKIEQNPRQPRYVQTVRGFGYRFGPL
ncbi:response regulator transcription factor [Rhodococcus erythropolis]|nr:response regulator transcription factor [Rhodococcus erythropolis]